MKKGFKLLIALVIAFFSITNAVRAEDLPKLPGYQADLSQTSVSGLSSGAFMTAQLHVAYSDKLIGAGIVAGGLPIVWIVELTILIIFVSERHKDQK